MLLDNDSHSPVHDSPNSHPNFEYTLEIEIHERMEDVEDQWLHFQKKAWHSPFQTFEWLNAWWQTQANQSDYKLKIIFGHNDGELLFIMPLMLQKTTVAEQITWMAAGINDYNAPLILPRILAALTPKITHKIWQEIAVRVPEADAFHFTKQPETILNIDNPFILSGAKKASCSAHMLPLDENWDKFYKQLRSKNTRKNIRQKTSKLEFEGQLKFENITEQSALLPAVETIINWKKQQLIRSGANSPFNNNIIKNTINANLQSNLADKNQMQLFALFIDAEMVAGLISFVQKDRFSIYISAYNPEFMPSCSPGLILMVKTLEFAARSGVEIFDFMAGDEAYKAQWCSQSLNLYDSYYGLSLNGKIHASISQLQLGIKRSAKTNKTVMNFLKSANSIRNRARNIQENPIDHS